MRAITLTRRPVAGRHGRPRTMEITLHIGAHRTATTSFQHYMRQNAPRLRRLGIGFWGPLRTRAGMFEGLMPDDRADGRSPDTARRRIGTALDRADKAGLRHLIVSDENILGRPSQNLSARTLYPECGDRLEALRRAFARRIDRTVVTVRPQPGYWPSLIAYAVYRGQPVPDANALDRIARDRRSWQDVLSDFDADRLIVLQHGCSPQTTLAAMLDGRVRAPAEHAGHRLNAAPDRPDLRAATDTRGKGGATIPAGEGRWQPFDADQRAMLAEAWLDDHFWLASGAGGLATWLPQGLPQSETTYQPERAGPNLPPGRHERGHTNGIEERRLVGSR